MQISHTVYCEDNLGGVSFIKNRISSPTDPVDLTEFDNVKSKAMKTFIYNYRDKNEDATDIVKWCRMQFGDRGDGWDFYHLLKRGEVIVEFKNEDYATAWVLAKE